SSSSELTKTLLTRSELKSLKDPIPNRSHTFACLIVKERLTRGAALLRVVAPSRSAHSREFAPGVKPFFMKEANFEWKDGFLALSLGNDRPTSRQ
ncbi:hypothetical protein, partial [Alcanivorax sp.]|uniref:hypothetical protein n=1 Tax=Alcanivorax sp. TaxID=1872427 RepID=UPI0032D92DE5